MVAVVVLLTLAAAGGAPSLLPERRQPKSRLTRWGVAGAQLVLLGAAALCAALTTGELGTAGTSAVVSAACLTATVGGAGLAVAVLQEVPVYAENQPEVLRGGTWIGALERLAAAATLLAGWPEGLALVLAVKGLARFSELKIRDGAAERFIIGTFASILWAAACAGIAVLAI